MITETPIIVLTSELAFIPLLCSMVGFYTFPHGFRAIHKWVEDVFESVGYRAVRLAGT